MSRETLRTAGTKPLVTIDGGRKVLRVGGVIQSVAIDPLYERDVWDAMLPETRPASALILGLGGGTIATLLTRRWGAVPITGVERDPAVVYLARREFGLDDLAHVKIVLDDAFTYVRHCAERFDVVCVDLYVAGKLAHGVLGGAFLRDVACCMTPNGIAAFNLWRSPYLPDQLRRLARALDVRTTIEIDENVVVLCGACESSL
ncbi:MAG: spermidine synthase [Ktedonobacterales bacterium]